MGHVNFVGRRNIFQINDGNYGLVELEITHFFELFQALDREQWNFIMDNYDKLK